MSKLETLQEFVNVLNSVNSTSFRISVTMFLICGTSFRYWITNEPPVDSWLMFLGTLSGLDFGVFWAKRHTFKQPEAPSIEDKG